MAIMCSDKHKTQNPLQQQKVEAFLDKVKHTPVRTITETHGRLIFALDATASREATWDQACHLQGQMFMETVGLGGLAVQLCYYRGFNEFSAGQWFTQSDDLLRAMDRVRCLGGHTQIEKLLHHTIEETRRHKVDALVFVGDCMEEKVDNLCRLAGHLAMQRVPIFVFHEGNDVIAAQAFRQLAQITLGAYCPFDSGSAQQLRDLLSAVAVYASGGRQALDDFHQRKGKTILRLSQPDKS